MRRRLIGCVYHLYQGDLDVGRVVLERLRAAGIDAEDFSYGAVAVAQRLEELSPEALVLVGAVERGRRAGIVERREVQQPAAADPDAQGAIADAVTGYVGLDLVVDVASALGALPPQTVVIEVEPETTASSERLSPTVERALDQLVRLVEAEVQALSSSPSP